MPPYDLQPGDGVRFTSELKGKVSTIEATVVSNSPEECSWQGGLPLGLLKGVHTCRSLSQDGWTTTKFVHDDVKPSKHYLYPTLI